MGIVEFAMTTSESEKSPPLPRPGPPLNTHRMSVGQLPSCPPFRESGEVWYRAASDSAALNLASDWVEAAGFSRAFSPAEVFIATWDRVGYFDAKGDKVHLV